MRFTSSASTSTACAVFVIFAYCIFTISPTSLVFASQTEALSGTQSRGWFSKVFPADSENDGDDKIMNSNQMRQQNDQGYEYGNGHGHGHAFIPQPGPGGAQPFMTPPPPPPMDADENFGNDDGKPKSGGEAPLPPPPPPMIGENQEDDKADDIDQSIDGGSGAQTEELLSQQQQQQWPPPPPPAMWGMGSGNDPNMNMMNPPPPLPQQHQYDEWSAQQQQQQLPPQPQYVNQQYADEWGHQQQEHQDYLQSEIDALHSHQHSLYDQIQNLTSTLRDSELKTDRQLNQIDQLLEQVADAEAYASAESNAALEYKANCTALSDTITSMQRELGDWEMKCKDMQEEQDCDRDEIAMLKQALKKKERELEKMACGIEMARLEEQREKYQQAKADRMMNHSSKGFFSWVLSLVFGDDMSSSGEDDSDEDLERLQEQAKSTLLSALQSERNNVDELEVALSAAQQNNSAIAEMVASRDSLIEELNDRVAVFEEDKVVLKAALRQLQKEMKEEAPKTQQLLSDLKATKDVIQSLESTIKSVEENHEQEILELNKQLAEKNNQINETDSRLQMIGVYVDKLEERLASFAIAKQEISKREEFCQSVENKASTTMEKLEKLKKEAADIENERNEMKKLVDLLVEERTLLQEERTKITKEKEKVDLECTSLREELDLLNDSFLHLEGEVKSAKEQLKEAQATILQREQSLNEMKTVNDQSSAKLTEQEDMIQKSITVTMNLQQEIQQLEEERVKSLSLIEMLEEKVELIVEQQAADAAARQAAEAAEREEAEREAAEAVEREVTTTAVIKTDEEVGKDVIEAMKIFKDPETLSEEVPGSFDDEENSLSTDSEGESASSVMGEPPLPPQHPLQPPPQNIPSQPKSRSVPFRGLRKAFSKTTGIHGLFTKPSQKRGY